VAARGRVRDCNRCGLRVDRRRGPRLPGQDRPHQTAWWARPRAPVSASA